ncbi:MAG: type II CAAX endopeptidase family protein [Longimicrobiales bacterium]
MRVRRRLRALGRVLGASLFVVVFNALAFVVLLALPPAAGVLWGAFLGSAFVLWHLQDDGRRRERLARIRLRPARASHRWLAVAVGASLALLWGLTGVIGWLAPPLGPDAMRGWEPLLDYIHRPGGWLAVAVLVAGVAPVVEEFCFRGHVQHTLERWWGTAPAIIVATLLFTVGHVGRPHWSILLVPLTLGLVNGTVVWLARSIWPAVVIHGLWNLAMVSTELTSGDAPAAVDDVPEAALLATALVLLGVGLAGWGWLLRKGRPPARSAGAGREGAFPSPPGPL